MQHDLVEAAKPRMDRAIEHLESELRGLRTGRASTALVDSLQVESYGSLQPLKAVASITVPDARSLVITPWDKTLLSVIEKVIRETPSLGLNPTNDGNVIRLAIPPMTEERRRDLTKVLGQKIEECRISLRNARHEALAEAKKHERDKQATAAQDDVKATETELNKVLDVYQKQIEAIQIAKTAEIMEI